MDNPAPSPTPPARAKPSPTRLATKLAEIPSWAGATAGESERRGTRCAREAQPYAICAGWVQVAALTKARTWPQHLRGSPRGHRESPRDHCAPLRTARKLRPRVMRHLAHHLRQGAGEGMEGEKDLVPPARTDHGAKDHVGLEDFGVGPINARAPPWVPDIVEQEDATGRRFGFDHHFGIGIAQQARAADRAGGRAGRESDRRLLEQHGATRIDARPADAQELVEIGKAPVS